MRNANAVVSDPNEFVTCSGDQYHILYRSHVLDDGTIELFEDGKEDIQQMINSQREQTDMAYILQRMAVGDDSVLASGAMYGDFTKIPKTYAEVLQLQLDAEREFYNLSLDVRNKFNNDFHQWLSTMNKPDWPIKMGFIKEEKVDEEVKKDES